MGVKIVISVIIGFLLLATYALCKAAGEYDDYMERGRNMSEQEQCQKAYEEYRRKFASDREITEEQATAYQAVKNYKEYLEKEYNVAINESGCE